MNREGCLSGAGAFAFETEQASKLKAEGVKVVDDKVDLKKYGWRPKIEVLESIASHLREEK